ncbi:MAG: TFIIB-type zinc ribbon-containing protein, partial [Planctomycetota bacterium]
MRCPSCESILSSESAYYCKIYPCPRCDGIWLQEAIFPRLASMLAANVEKSDRDYMKLFKPRDVASPDSQKGPRLCPQCQTVMSEFNFAYDSNIFLDRCPRCRGVWSDAGEILKVAEHLKMDPRIYEVGQCLIGEDAVTRDARRVEIFMNVIFRILAG